jgi:hypothetical protein
MGGREAKDLKLRNTRHRPRFHISRPPPPTQGCPRATPTFSHVDILRATRRISRSPSQAEKNFDVMSNCTRKEKVFGEGSHLRLRIAAAAGRVAGIDCFLARTELRSAILTGSVPARRAVKLVRVGVSCVCVLDCRRSLTAAAAWPANAACTVTVAHRVRYGRKRRCAVFTGVVLTRLSMEDAALRVPVIGLGSRHKGRSEDRNGDNRREPSGRHEDGA